MTKWAETQRGGQTGTVARSWCRFSTGTQLMHKSACSLKAGLRALGHVCTNVSLKPLRRAAVLEELCRAVLWDGSGEALPCSGQEERQPRHFQNAPEHQLLGVLMFPRQHRSCPKGLCCPRSSLSPTTELRSLRATGSAAKPPRSDPLPCLSEKRLTQRRPWEGKQILHLYFLVQYGAVDIKKSSSSAPLEDLQPV